MSRVERSSPHSVIRCGHFGGRGRHR